METHATSTAATARAADDSPELILNQPSDRLIPGVLLGTLTACGGSGSSSPEPAPAPTPLPEPPVETITDAEAARFLHQTSLAASDNEITRVKTLGYSAWLDEQFAKPRSQSHWDWMMAKGYQNDTNAINSFRGMDNSLWRKLLSSPDSVRQRAVMALSEIFVVSMAGLPVAWRGFCMAAYVDILEANTFGTYRNLLEVVTLSTGMGNYLNMRGNQKEDSKTGRVPDENYAREVLQLFSIGLYELNQDGTLTLNSDGKSIETYSQSAITNLARVFTGWEYTQFDRATPDFQQRPMSLIASRHSTLDASFLGATIAGSTSGEQALKAALDTIANHPNVGPFICRQLIQRLVTSNPSAAYIGRVAAVFNNNGKGVRGDLAAVFKAIWLDAEARAKPATHGPGWGKLREPMLRFVQWGRTFGVTSATDAWNIGDTSDPSSRLGQSPLRSPTVFNYFRPAYVPPNTSLGSQNLVAPELQITNESTVIAYANYMQTAIQNGVGEVKPDYSSWLTVANDAATLVDKLALLLSASQLTSSTRNVIATAVGSIAATTDATRLNRIHASILLIMTAPDYLVQK